MADMVSIDEVVRYDGAQVLTETQKGNARGNIGAAAAADLGTKADLVGGKVPIAQLPPFDDDVLEYASAAQFPATGRTGRIYVATDRNELYRWTGAAYAKFVISGMLTGSGWALYPVENGGDGKWHRVVIANGALAYDSEGVDAPPGGEHAAQADLDAEVRRATAAEAMKANDADVVKMTGNQTIGGVKTFGRGIVVQQEGVRRDNDTTYVYIQGGTGSSSARITLAGHGYSGTALPAGGAMIYACDGANVTSDGAVANSTASLTLSPQGLLKLVGFGPSKDPQVYGSQFAMAGMPSGTVTNLSVPESGGFLNFGTPSAPSYKCPYSGWVNVLVGDADATGPRTATISLKNASGADVLTCHASYSQYLKHGSAVIPVRAGFKVSVTYASGTVFERVRFARAEAEVTK